jgi:hypothetical protein
MPLFSIAILRYFSEHYNKLLAFCYRYFDQQDPDPISTERSRSDQIWFNDFKARKPFKMNINSILNYILMLNISEEKRSGRS